MTNKISESEKRVMEVLWQDSPQSSSSVADRLQDQNWSEKTVRTFLNRLVKKQFVAYQRAGRRYLFSPLIERSAFLKQESKNFLATVFRGDVKELLATFVQNKQLSASELNYLEKLLKDETDK